MNIVFLTSEVSPFSKTGGLADVSAGLSKALKSKGNDIRIFTPYYQSCEKFKPSLVPDSKISIRIGDADIEANLYEIKLPGCDVIVYLIDNKHYFFRETLYSRNNVDYEDNFARFVLFQRASIEYIIKLNLRPDIVHSNDWPAALTSVYLKTIYASSFPKTKTVFTIHNIAYQGLFWVWDMKLTGLPFELFNWRQLEYYGKLNLLKGGIVFSDAVTTVSPTYAQEIMSAQFAYGLQSILEENRDKLHGIVNGADYDEWSPERDSIIQFKYHKNDISGKYANTRALSARCGFNNDGAPILGMIGRLVEQKGVKFIIETIDRLMSKNLKIVILGAGDKNIENILLSFNNRFPKIFKAFIMFNAELAHLIEAGSDIYLMPSLFEPCGLNQLYSLRYGTIPLVRRTGGLADTVVDCNPANINAGIGTGFVFNNISNLEFADKVDYALSLYSNKELWRKLMYNAMSQDWSWNLSGDKYIQLYKSLL